MHQGPRYFTTGQVSKKCEVSLVTVKQWIRSGKLKAFRTPGGHFRIPAAEFERLRNRYGFLAEPSKEPRILIVDDDPEVVALLMDALRRTRPAAKLETAFDGYEGILKVGTFRPDLLVLDLRMPGVDGLEVCRRIKGDPATRTTRILAITAYPEDYARERAFECGADAFLTKPFTVKALKARVRRLISPDTAP